MTLLYLKMVGISDRLIEKQWGNSRRGDYFLEGVRADGGYRMDFKRWGKKREKMCLKEIIGLLQLAHIQRK